MKNIIAYLKILLLSICISLVFYGVYYSVNSPISANNIIELQNNKIKDPSQEGVSGLKGVNTNQGGNTTSSDGIDYIPTDIKRLANTKTYRKAYQEQLMNTSPREEVGFAGINDRSYDKDIYSITQLDDLDNTRENIFKEDLIQKTIFCFLISFLLLTLIKYSINASKINNNH